MCILCIILVGKISQKDQHTFAHGRSESVQRVRQSRDPSQPNNRALRFRDVLSEQRTRSAHRRCFSRQSFIHRKVNNTQTFTIIY